VAKMSTCSTSCHKLFSFSADLVDLIKYQCFQILLHVSSYAIISSCDVGYFKRTDT
jgi:hypothetical protein